MRRLTESEWRDAAEHLPNPETSRHRGRYMRVAVPEPFRWVRLDATPDVPIEVLIATFELAQVAVSSACGRSWCHYIWKRKPE